MFQVTVNCDAKHMVHPAGAAQPAWAWHGTGALPPGVAVGEGCAVFIVERGATRSTPNGTKDGASRQALAEVLACEVAFCPTAGPDQPPPLAEGLTTCMERALSRSRVEPDEVSIVSLGAADQTCAEHRIEEQALRRVLGGIARQVRVKEILGECYSASGALQLAALLALWRQEPQSRSGTALVTSVGRDGNVGCLVVRSGPGWDQ